MLCKSDLAESEYWSQQLLKTSEEILQDLELTYRIVETCTGDLGVGKYRMRDIETWVPSENKYRETYMPRAALAMDSTAHPKRSQCGQIPSFREAR